MTQANLPSKILVVDDDLSIAKGIENGLQRYGISVVAANSFESALYLFNSQRFEVVLIAMDYEALPGLALVQKWRNHEVFEKSCTGFVMMASAKRTNEQESLVKELGELEFIQKPFKEVQLLPILTRALATKNRLQNFRDLEQQVQNLYEKTGSPEKAVALLQKKIPELGVKGFKMLYEFQEKAVQYDDALTIINSMMQKNPKDISLTNAKGRILLKQGKTTEAKQYFEKADQLAPNNIERINAMAEMYLKLKMPEESIAKMKELLKLNPDNPAMKFDMFSQLCDYGFDQHAVDFCKETTNPMEIVRHYNNHGVMLVKEGKLDEALSEYEKALMFYPNYKENYRIYFNIALARVQKKTKDDYQLAVESLEKCLEMQPDFDKAKVTKEKVESALSGSAKKAG